MVIPKRFQTTSPAIASYDYFDLTSQTGYVTFYGMLAEDSTGDVYILNRNQIEGKSPSSSVAQASNQTFQFDATFTKPFLLDGDSICEFAFLANEQYGSPETFTATTDYKLYHVDVSSTATQIGSTITEVATSLGNSSSKSEKQTAVINIDSQLFKKGEKLRVEIKLTVSSSGNSNSTGVLYHDPTGGTAVLSNYSSQLLFRAPIKIQP